MNTPWYDTDLFILVLVLLGWFIIIAVCLFHPAISAWHRLIGWISHWRRDRAEAHLNRYQHDVLQQAIDLNAALMDQGHEARVALLKAAWQASQTGSTSPRDW